MTPEDLHARVVVVENEIENLKRRDDMLENGIQELRKELHDTRSEISKKMDDVQKQLRDVVLGALNSMPEWATRQFGNNHKLIGALISLLGIAVSALLWIILRHGV